MTLWYPYWPVNRCLNAPMKTLSVLSLHFIVCTSSVHASPLFKQEGTDPTFTELISSGRLKKGKTLKTGVNGSRIIVDRALVETSRESKQPIPSAIRIHTLANSMIPRADFGKWTRWYQECGSTQVFRLFKDEVNTRNNRPNAARVEAFSVLTWQKGDWHEWSGTYTIVKPHGAAIFQAKNNINDWSVQINMNMAGDVILNHRRGPDKVIAKNMVGKPFRIKVRDNGEEYVVFLNGAEIGRAPSNARLGNPLSAGGCILVKTRFQVMR